VDDRKLFWKKNPKFIFCGFIIASSNVESIIFASESVHVGTAALGCPKVYFEQKAKVNVI
jgi:predicted negative regulator of RcsB-dependent stress response